MVSEGLYNTPYLVVLSLTYILIYLNTRDVKINLQ